MKPYDPEKRHAEYIRNSEKYKEQRKKYAEENKEAKKKGARDYYHKNKVIDPIRYLLKYAKLRAKQKGIEFSLTKEDIVIPKLCPYLQVPLTIAGDRKHSPSIDRIDPSLGYSKDNIEIISTLANSMKWNSTREELIQFAKSVLSKEDIK
jgi:hypothetical protein